MGDICAVSKMQWMSLFLLFTITQCYAIDVTKDVVVRNRGNYCAYASLEMLGKINQVYSLDGLLDSRIKADNEKRTYTYAYDNQLKKELDHRNVRYKFNNVGSKETDLLEQYSDSNGVMVSIMPGNGHSSIMHAIVIIYYDDKIVKFYDTSNLRLRAIDDNNPKVWTATRQWFDTFWSGGSCVVLPDLKYE
jgi:hypothetical protein